MWMMPLHQHVNQKSDYDDMMNAAHEIYKVSSHMAGSYNPRDNGCVERHNATIDHIYIQVNKTYNIEIDSDYAE